MHHKTLHFRNSSIPLVLKHTSQPRIVIQTVIIIKKLHKADQAKYESIKLHNYIQDMKYKQKNNTVLGSLNHKQFFPHQKNIPSKSDKQTQEGTFQPQLDAILKYKYLHYIKTQFNNETKEKITIFLTNQRKKQDSQKCSKFLLKQFFEKFVDDFPNKFFIVLMRIKQHQIIQQKNHLFMLSQIPIQKQQNQNKNIIVQQDIIFAKM
eukprot:TRINITY_DN3344_c1_g1_i13.p5 TRINITY_DN3344_c1_g1~~TRINITY_DN3344_c1_g1_i13.p5  ORF type:complete len:207 (+),score=-6.07 TRINITY_DN3344_c1_g1_i13:164-784(+)